MPLFLKKPLEDGSFLSIWKIQETEEQLRAMLTLFPEEQAELEDMRSEKSRLGHLAARVALKKLLTVQQPVLSLKDEHGKPYLPAVPGYISLSHSGQFGVAVMHPHKPVGVDIEKISPKVRKIAQKFLKATEIQLLGPRPTLEMLYVCWCMKESAFKWYGKKGISLKNHMTIQPFRDLPSDALQLEFQDGAKQFSLSFRYEKIEDYILAYIWNA